MYIYIYTTVCAAGAEGIAATGPPWLLYVLSSGMFPFVFVACVSVYHTRGLSCNTLQHRAAHCNTQPWGGYD